MNRLSRLKEKIIAKQTIDGADLGLPTSNHDQSRPEMAEHLARPSFGHTDLKISAIYICAALIWIFASDYLINTIAPDHGAHGFLQTTKGVMFVIVTGLVLYVTLRGFLRREFHLAAQLQRSVNASRSGLWAWDVVNDHIVVTPGGDVEVGWAAADAIRDTKSWQAIVHPEDWGQVAELLRDLNESGRDYWQIEQRFQTKEGGWHWFQIKGNVSSRGPYGAIRQIEGTYFSVDGLKQTQRQLERANRALTVLVATYNAVVTSRSEKELFDTLVGSLAKSQEYVLVWIGEAEEAQKRIVPVSAAGPSKAFLDAATIRWDDGGYGTGPSGSCIRTGEPSIIEDVREDVRAENWLQILDEFNIRSAVSIPIFTDGKAKYVLQLDCAEPAAFSANDIETYELISRNLSLAVSSMDLYFRFEQSESARLQIASRLERALYGTIKSLTKVVEKRDPYTAGHQQRVAELSVAFGTEMGLSKERLEGIYIGASIHDIGKIGVPTEILSKPGRLDDEEIALIRRHASIGDDIVRDIDFGWPVGQIVHEHHERWDGSGYPSGLKGEEISVEARIVAVADVVESMGTNRPYRPAIPWAKVLEEIEDGSGSRYEPKVVDAALRVLERDAGKFGFGPSV